MENFAVLSQWGKTFVCAQNRDEIISLKKRTMRMVGLMPLYCTGHLKVTIQVANTSASSTSGSDEKI